MSEHDEQVKLFNTLRLHEDKYPELRWIHAIPNGGQRHEAVARKMKAEGQRSGVWDIFVPEHRYCIADNEMYGGMYIEMKFGKNKLTKNQKEFEKAVRKNYKTAVCYSAEEAFAAIMDYLGLDLEW